MKTDNVNEKGNVFDWTRFDREAFYKAKERVNSYEYDLDDYEGCVRIGELCFDIMNSEDDNNNKIMGFYLYCGGVDTGYAYSRIEKDYPYTDIDFGKFDPKWTEMGYNEFKVYAEKTFHEFIDYESKFYESFDLREKANTKLHLW